MREEVVAAISGGAADLDRALRDYPEVESAEALEVVLSPGELLYLPALWSHFIVSLSQSIQCGARTGFDWPMEMKQFHEDDLQQCGWPMMLPCQNDSDCGNGRCMPGMTRGKSNGRPVAKLCHNRVGQRCPRAHGFQCESGICTGAEHSDDGYDTCRLAAGAACSADAQCASNVCRNFVCVKTR